MKINVLGDSHSLVFNHSKVMDLIQKESRRLSDDDAYELHEKLKEFFNRLF